MAHIPVRYRFAFLLIFAAAPAFAQSTFEQDLARQRAEQQRNEENAKWQRQPDEAYAEAEAEAETDAQSQTPIARPRDWASYAAAVTWGDSKVGAVYVGAENYFDEQAARARVMEQCTAKGWKNCAIAESVRNGVIVVGRQGDGNLRTRWGATAAEAIPAVTEACAKISVQCKVERESSITHRNMSNIQGQDH